MLRVVLFVLTNLAIMLLLWVTAGFLGLDQWLTQNGISWPALLGFCAIFGMGGAFISLLISKPMAKAAMRVQLIGPTGSLVDQRLYNRVQRLAQQAGIGMPEVGIYEGRPNAFATGAFKNSALVAVSTGLLESMTEEEVDAVLAHEVSHIANGDMVTLTLLQGVINTFVMVVARAVGQVVDKVVFKTERGTGPGYFMTIIVLEILLGILASTLVMAFSRHREFRADAGAARLMGSPRPMIAALQRLGNLSTEPLPKAMSAFGISGMRTARFGRLFMSHPPLEARIEALRNPRQFG
jgi:heat shock protein HtpX